MSKLIRLSFLLIILSGCSSHPEDQEFDFFLNEPCMITNLEQNNLIEGTQLRVEYSDESTSIIVLKLPENLPINSNNRSKWTVGWGNREPYFDAGVENIRFINKIDPTTGTIYLDRLMRGKGFPKVGQRIVLWNTEQSNYLKMSSEPVIPPSLWPEFNGKSIGFSSIVFDSNRKVWITLVYEVDSNKTQIYVAISSDLINWKAGNEGKPILTSSDFAGCSWTPNDQTPRVSEIIQHEGKYYMFMDAEDKSGKRHIGMATASDLLGDYSIKKKPVLSPQTAGTWNDESVFCAKIAKRNSDFILFFDGRNEEGYEQVGRAISKNLETWEMDSDPVLDQHTGWRSAGFTSEPNYVEAKGDTIILMVAGAKQFQEGHWHNYITQRGNLDRSGNVNDAQLGAFISTDGGKSFNPHPNNPVFVNAYCNPNENEHMGGNFDRIETDSVSYIFYQAKSSSEGMKYSIFLRFKTK